jgi:hypothetical protein
MQAIIQPNGRVLEVSPDDMPWEIEEGMQIVHVDDWDFTRFPPDWEYVDGEFVYREPPPEPYSPAEAIAIMMRGDVTDAEAVRLKPYIPAYDASRAYAEGELAVRYGKVARRTSSGWRELG